MTDQIEELREKVLAVLRRNDVKRAAFFGPIVPARDGPRGLRRDPGGAFGPSLRGRQDRSDGRNLF